MKKFAPKTTISSSIMCRWRRSRISKVFKEPKGHTLAMRTGLADFEPMPNGSAFFIAMA
jgi:hypothetical protein